MTVQQWTQTSCTLELSRVLLKDGGAQALTPTPLCQTLGRGAWASALRLLGDSNFAARVKNTALEC